MDSNILPAPMPAGLPLVKSSDVRPNLSISLPRSTMFVCYRRFDSQDVTGRIYDRLVSRYTSRQVFKDVDSIPLGVSFPTHIRGLLNRADVMLVIIGPSWLNCVDDYGRRRLRDPNDFVRLEVELALGRKMPVIPLLVSNASMPHAAELPPSMRRLASRQAIQIRPDPDFNNDITRFLKGLDHLEKRIQPKSTRIRQDRCIRSRPTPSKTGSSVNKRSGGLLSLTLGVILAVLLSMTALLCGIPAIRLALDNRVDGKVARLEAASSVQEGRNGQQHQGGNTERQDPPAAVPAVASPPARTAASVPVIAAAPASAVASPPARQIPPPPPPPPVPNKVVYDGAEDLPGFGPLTFHLYEGGRAVMIDAKGTTEGSWQLQPTGINLIELRFGDAIYYEVYGTINGLEIGGFASNGIDYWCWRVWRQP